MQKFGRYNVEKWLGGGGMADVYVAQDTLLGRRVAPVGDSHEFG